MLMSNLVDNNSLYDKMTDRIDDIEKNCEIYKAEIFTDEKRFSKKKANRFYAPDKCKLV